MLEFEYFDCDCASSEHTLRFLIENDIRFEDWPPELYTEVYLNHYESFWKRSIAGIKYIFGYKSKYGHWDCTILRYEQIPKFRKMLDRYEELVKKYMIKKEKENE